MILTAWAKTRSCPCLEKKIHLLLDTHILLWSAGDSEKLSTQARDLILDQQNLLYFSAASIWEIVIKRGLGRNDFQVEPEVLRRGLEENQYQDLPVTSVHAAAVGRLPAHTQRPF
jgi:PIN domain nuclease of toxin-antitoxin system